MIRRSRIELLISVRVASEVPAALDGGADWIDLKEPSRGALGPVDVEVAEEIVSVVGGRCPLSAALGELSDLSDDRLASLLDVAGIDVLKVGMHGAKTDSNWRAKWLGISDKAHRHRKHLAAVAYADWMKTKAPSPQEMFELGSSVGSRYLLIDTFDKSSGPVSGMLSVHELRTLTQQAKSLGMSTVVAGGVRVADLASLPVGWIDRVAVRGGVCRGGRSGRVEPELVREFRAVLGVLGQSNSGS